MSMYSEAERAEIEATARRHLAERNGVPQRQEPASVSSKEIHIETREERRAREAREDEERKAAADAERKAARDLEVAAQRKHELALWKAYGAAQNTLPDDVDWPELFNSISDAIAGLTRGIEAVQKRLDTLEQNNESKTLAAKFDASNARHNKEIGELKTQLSEVREAATKAEQHAAVQCRILAVELATMRKAPAQAEQVVRVFHDR